MYQIIADMVLLVHFAFIAFVLFGGLLLLRWPRLVWLHLPAIIWAVFIEMTAWLCPLTPLENYFRALAGSGLYHGDFVARYFLPLIYPAGLTPALQLVLAGAVIVINGIVYSVIIWMRCRAHKAERHSAR